jgi:hypothetical protein
VKIARFWYAASLMLIDPPKKNGNGNGNGDDDNDGVTAKEPAEPGEIDKPEGLNPVLGGEAIDDKTL